LLLAIAAHHPTFWYKGEKKYQVCYLNAYEVLNSLSRLLKCEVVVGQTQVFHRILAIGSPCSLLDTLKLLISLSTLASPLLSNLNFDSVEVRDSGLSLSSYSLA